MTIKQAKQFWKDNPREKLIGASAIPVTSVMMEMIPDSMFPLMIHIRTATGVSTNTRALHYESREQFEEYPPYFDKEITHFLSVYGLPPAPAMTDVQKKVTELIRKRDKNTHLDTQFMIMFKEGYNYALEVVELRAKEVESVVHGVDVDKLLKLVRENLKNGIPN